MTAPDLTPQQHADAAHRLLRFSTSVTTGQAITHALLAIFGVLNAQQNGTKDES